MLFIKTKPCRIMSLLRSTDTVWYLTRLAKSSDTTYVYVTHLITTLVQAGFVTVEKKCKNKIVKLTEKGLRAANTIEDLTLQLKDTIPVSAPPQSPVSNQKIDVK